MHAAHANFQTSARGFSEPATRDELTQVRWYAAYTSAHHEKRVTAEMLRRSIECFLPVYSSIRRWKDRRVQLNLPLFPSYVFARFALAERLRVLQVPGVAHLVRFGGRIAPVPESEISRIQNLLTHGLRAEPYPYLTAGKRVRVETGPLAGYEGLIVKRKNKLRFILSVNLIMRSLAVEVDPENLRLI
jgi:transcription antitermination factor NusG